MILAIDPGNVESGYVVLNNNLSIRKFGKIDNYELLEHLRMDDFIEDDNEEDYFAIEMIANMGMSAVGATIFETCVWIGRFVQACQLEAKYIYRREEKINLCDSMKAKDKNIRMALIDRFGIVGVKKAPGFFYGFKADMWAAMAVAVTFHDLYLKEGVKDAT